MAPFPPHREFALGSEARRLRLRALELLELGLIDLPRKLLTAASMLFADVNQLHEQAQVYLDLADVERRAGDAAAREDWLLGAFVTAGAAGDRARARLAIETLNGNTAVSCQLPAVA